MVASRRQFMAGLGATVLAPRLSLAEDAPDGFKVIRAQAAQSQLLATAGTATTVWRFETGSAPPLITARQGEELKLRFINELPVELWLHWFGVRGPDGLMTLHVLPGEEQAVDCVFTPPDAGTFWLGPLINASQLRDRGLYAMLVVKGEGEPALIEQPMLLDDWMLDDNGAMLEDFGNLQAAIGEGRLGNWFTVNGLYRPDIEVPAAQMARLRFMNAANVRTMRVLFKGPTPRLAALDGQPLEAIEQLENGALELEPGQRADLVLEAGSEELVLGLDLFEETAELCHIRRTGEAGVAVVPPGMALPPNPVSRTLDLAGARTIPLVLQGGAKGGMQRARLDGVEYDLRGLLERGKAWAINGVAGPAQASIGQFRLGETIILDIDNQTAFAQPMHLHGHVWQQLVEEGGQLKTVQPWRDTAVISPRSRQKLAFLADNKGAWMLQSLVAERSDSGLISAFTVG